MAWHNTTFAIEPADRASQLAAVAFDACTWEIWPYLAAGASVHLDRADDASALAPCGRGWRSSGITRAFMPTPLAEVLLREALPATLRLRTLLVGGDRLTQGPPVGTPFTVVNNYGPTESSVVATSGVVPPGSPDARPPDIGRPIANTRIYILDAAGLPVPIGVRRRDSHRRSRSGARLSQSRVAHGREVRRRSVRLPARRPPLPHRRPGALSRRREHRLHRPQRSTRSRFAASASSPEKSRRVLRAHARGGGRRGRGARGQRPATSALSAYVTARPGAELDADGLRRHAQATLPDYMVPAAFVIMASLPLTGHGKVDRAGCRRRSTRRSDRDAGIRVRHRARSDDCRGLAAELQIEPRRSRRQLLRSRRPFAARSCGCRTG